MAHRDRRTWRGRPSHAWPARARSCIAAALICLALAGCATYSDSALRLESAIVQGNPAPAIAELEKNQGPLRDEVLRQLNLAILLRVGGDYQRSNAALETAKAIIEQRQALSLTEQASSLVINESMTSFVGEDFEQAMVHFYAALNYLQLNQRYEARVEALQVDLLLKRLKDASPGDPHVYAEDALCRYLAGMIFEDLEEWSDALIAYRKAFEAYERYNRTFGVPVPSFLKQDLLRLTKRQGLSEELRDYEQRFALASWPDFDQWRSQGEVVVLIHAGLAPIKRSQVLRVVEPKHGQLVSIALPSYVPRPDPVQRVEVSANNHAMGGERVQDIGNIAMRSLEARLPGLTAKAIARASLKYNLSRRAEAKEGDVAGFLVNVLGAFTEVADTRSWITLPDNVYLARLALAPGTYTVNVQIAGTPGGAGQRFSFENVNVRAGRKTFLEKHWAGAIGRPTL